MCYVQFCAFVPVGDARASCLAGEFYVAVSEGSGLLDGKEIGTMF